MKANRGGLMGRIPKPALESGTGNASRLDRKSVDSALCPVCRASCRKGRWTWEKAPVDAIHLTCPACRRIADDHAGAWLELRGGFFEKHHDEILALVRAKEAHEKAEHPLQRIIAIREEAGRAVVSTTDPHLARIIGAAIESAYKGTLVLRYAEGENRLRAAWER